MKKPKMEHNTGESNVAVYFKMVVGIVINIIIILTIITFIDRNESGSNVTADPYIVPRSEADPLEHQEVILTDVSSAVTEANEILAAMQSNFYIYGSFPQINPQCDNFQGVFYLDHDIGNVLYWELQDRNVTVRIDGIEEKIIYYYRTGWLDGAFTEEDAKVRAEDIISHFVEGIPDDAEDPTSSLNLMIINIFETAQTEDRTYENWTNWVIRYNRTWGSGENMLPTEDSIVLYLDKNGTCRYYSYIWYMNLTEVEKNYLVAQQDAESTATDYAGQGSVVVTTEKKIVRPNYFWIVDDSPEDNEGEPTLAFGMDPIIVYEIWVRDGEDNLLIFHVNGRVANDIVGGDFSQAYYYDPPA